MQLNDAIKTYYDEWYNDAPASYKQGVLLNAAPIAICIKYGQNRLICVGEDDQADACAERSRASTRTASLPPVAGLLGRPNRPEGVIATLLSTLGLY